MALTIRPSADETKEIEKLCNFLEKKEASKAILIAVKNYILLVKKIAEQKEEIRTLKNSLTDKTGAIQDFLSSLANLQSQSKFDG